jgi:hypothetical protein
MDAYLTSETKSLTRLQDGDEPHHHYCDYNSAGAAYHCCHLEQVQMSVFVLALCKVWRFGAYSSVHVGLRSSTCVQW